jgi:DNA-binding response OmpR family regulator
MDARDNPDRVRLIEDDARLRSVLARTMQRYGHEVIEAEGVMAARAILEKHCVRAAVIDVNLPDSTGWDIVRWVRLNCDPAPKLIVISAAGFPARHVRDLRPDVTLSKPFPIDALIQHLDRPASGDTTESR